MKLVTAQGTDNRRARGDIAPTISIYFGGGDGDSDTIGVARISVPAKGAMPPHKHGGSDIVITTCSGSVVIGKEDEQLEVKEGDSVMIFQDEAVSLENPNDTEAVLIVSAGPANFISKNVKAMPEA